MNVITELSKFCTLDALLKGQSKALNASDKLIQRDTLAKPFLESLHQKDEIGVWGGG